MNLTLTAADGQPVWAYQASPANPHGGVVVLHEAFGVTPHIQDMCNWLAEAGYHAVAPEMFSRAEANPAARILPYNKEGLEAGRAYIMAMPREKWVEDMAAAVAYLQEKGLKTATLGYCWGGSLAYMGACNIAGVAAADCYYGGLLADLVAHMQPACPVQFHLASHDRYVPLQAAQAAIAAHLPSATVHVYDADHGFNRTGGATYDEAASTLARARTLQFLQATLRA